MCGDFIFIFFNYYNRFIKKKFISLKKIWSISPSLVFCPLYAFPLRPPLTNDMLFSCRFWAKIGRPRPKPGLSSIYNTEYTVSEKNIGAPKIWNNYSTIQLFAILDFSLLLLVKFNLLCLIFGINSLHIFLSIVIALNGVSDKGGIINLFAKPIKVINS